MTEADLCLKLESYYRDWDCYKEVPSAGGRLDFYVNKGGLWVAVEVKRQLSCKLIMQAYRHMKHAHFSFIAIPTLNDFSGVSICKKLGIGVLVYRYGPYVEGWQEVSPPSFQRKIMPYRVLDRMKNAVAGVQHNTESEFKITLDLICKKIKKNGGRYPIKKLFEESHYHYSSSKSAMQAIKKYCQLGAIKEFTIKESEFILTENNLS